MSIRAHRRPTRGLQHRLPATVRGIRFNGAWIAVASLLLVVGRSQGEMPGFDEGLPAGVAGQAPCACRGSQTPPWHGSVAAAPGGWYAPACGPACAPACGHGYGPACGHMGAGCGWWSGRGMGYSLPPFFPRLSTFCREGWLPTPPPVAVPRCHNCGAMIDGGF